jgi:kumamolisin
MTMKFSTASLAIAATLFAGCAVIGLAQNARPGTRTNINIPASRVANAADAGVRSHTNIQILGSPKNSQGTPQVAGPPFPGYFYEDPASLACIYNLQPPVRGCNPNVVTRNPTGGSRAIAVVDAYDDPNVYMDLQNFSAQFGVAPITPTSFQVVYAPAGGATPGSCTGPATQPPSAGPTGWDVEEALDIEYAHSMAPAATTLYLVEAQSNFNSDLLCGVTVASNLVAKAGGGEVSMSWGGGEFSGETSLDSLFTTPKVVYFASTGDSPGIS